MTSGFLVQGNKDAGFGIIDPLRIWRPSRFCTRRDRGRMPIGPRTPPAAGPAVEGYFTTGTSEPTHRGRFGHAALASHYGAGKELTRNSSVKDAG